MTNKIEEIIEDLYRNTMGNPPYRIDRAKQAIYQVIEGAMPKYESLIDGRDEFAKGELLGKRIALSDTKQSLSKLFGRENGK